jgi:plastocyanin
MPRTRRPIPSARGALVGAAFVAVAALVSSCGGDGGGGERRSVTVTTGAGDTSASVTVGAHDVYFDVTEINAPAGALEVDLVERGAQTHSFVVDGVDGFKLEVSGGSRNDTGSLELEAGTYTYYCDVPGHRGQGMEGRLVVS